MIDSVWLSARQNRDGGWGYAGGGSAVEPTAWSLLALHALNMSDSGVFRSGAAWISGLQRSDGGWAPRSGVSESTWVTALIPILPNHAIRETSSRAATDWLLARAGRESSLVYRLRLTLLGVRSDTDDSNDGWPWFPDTAAWVMPTSLAMIALRKMRQLTPSDRIAKRLHSGQEFLFARRCSDGGWNHGASIALGYNASSYPETTGVGLLALVDAPKDRLTRSLETAERHLAATQSREAASWLQLGLSAHGRNPVRKQYRNEPRTVLEGALSVLSEVALQGRNVLIG